MAELADAADLKSADPKGLWGFESPSRHHSFLSLRPQPPTNLQKVGGAHALAAAGSARNPASPLSSRSFNSAALRREFQLRAPARLCLGRPHPQQTDPSSPLCFLQDPSPRWLANMFCSPAAVLRLALLPVPNLCTVQFSLKSPENGHREEP